MNDIIGILRSYYRQPAVRQRIGEFLGGDCIANATCQYITADGTARADRKPLPPEDLPLGLEGGLDICRSLWDREALIAHLDVEYVNFDFAAEPYLDPGRAFELQEPVARTIDLLFEQAGICPLHVLSGRGHHYAWSISARSSAFDSLVAIGNAAAFKDTTSYPPRGCAVSPVMACAFAGLGLVMEFFAHKVKKLASPLCEIPVDLTAVEVGPSARGREMISIDISEYGDPLHTRTVRVPFSGYLKPWQQKGMLGDHIVNSLDPLIFVPLSGQKWQIDTHRMRSPAMASELADTTSAKIPEQTDGTRNLIDTYAVSSLRTFHEWFYSEDHETPENWRRTYDRLDGTSLPPCARHVLACPNDLLLRPCNMRLLTHVLLARGWHPRHIAGLIRSKFERDYGWGEQWVGYDPSTRADFYTRIFAGLFAVGVDDLVDLNCRSAHEKGTCPTGPCSDNLEHIQKLAREIRDDDKLAGGDFHGMFLQEKHS